MCCAVPPLPPSPHPLRARNEEGGDDGYDACGVREAERWRGDEGGDRGLGSVRMVWLWRNLDGLEKF